MKYAAALVLGLLPLMANALQTGDPLPSFTLQDQHDQPYTLAADTRIVLAAHDMDGAKLVKAAIVEQPKGYLEARKAVFVADIEKMPAIISKMFAVPAMREYPYRVLLDRDGKVVSSYPVEEGKVLWLQLEQGAVVAQEQFTDAQALKAKLDQASVQ